MIYRFCKNMINLGRTEGLIEKLDIFFAVGHLTEDEYMELRGLVEEVE